MIRGDLSSRLVHLTRGSSYEEASAKFLSIIKSGVLRGSNRDIRGGFNCVCFSEAPLSVLAESLALPPSGGMRYAPFGVIVSKPWLFKKGGRPVIYQTNDEFEFLNENQKFRHVRYDPQENIDFTWEREWRIRIDSLKLEPKETTFIVPTRDWEERFHQDHIDEVASATYVLEHPIDDPMPWHFLVLEDLGVHGFDEAAFKSIG